MMEHFVSILILTLLPHSYFSPMQFSRAFLPQMLGISTRYFLDFADDVISLYYCDITGADFWLRDIFEILFVTASNYVPIAMPPSSGTETI
jgi:hypothetical protein